MSEFKTVNSTPEMAEQLEAVQRASFPHLSEEEIITAAHYRAQIKVFPEGQFAVVDEAGKVVASSTDMRCKMDFDHYQHRFIEQVGHNWLTTHDPEGDWLYGADIGVHPQYRGHGLSKLLYDARKDLCRRLNLKGHVAGGLLAGYGAMADRMTPEAYVAEVVAGTRFDPTLSIQLRRGFVAMGIIRDYVDDPSCADTAALIVWKNPDYKPVTAPEPPQAAKPKAP
jgi:GNAT superfamily N-acetyltransferase